MTDAPEIIQPLADALEARGYEDLTPVQKAVVKPDLGNADLLVSAQTGSGKTVGFGLAIAPTLLGEETRFGPAATPLALVIAPTRELAMQVKRELDWLYAKTGAIVTSCVGGMDMRDERRALDRGAHIVVGTPGRLVDHIRRNSLDMSAMRAVVLDEADEMLDLGFREDLEFILGEAPEDRRTLMFSATVPRAIASLAEGYQKDAIRVTTVAEKSQHADIEYRALSVASPDPENAIINVLRYYEAQNAIVFCNTRAMVNRLTARFSNRGFAVVALSGELSQNERSHALQAMRDGRARVCVATDVAARGIDLPNLELVIHAELPNNSETLLHRSGRTGRAGRKGVSALIVPARARKKAERLLKFAKINAEWAAPPSAEEVLRRDEERLLADPVWTEAVSADEQEFVTKLVELHSAEQIAAAYMRLYRDKHSAPEELAKAGPDDGKRQREAFGPSTWFSVSVGRSQNAEPRWLLPMLCRAGNITKDEIGAIRIQQEETFVELSQSCVSGFVAAIGPDMQLEGEAKLTQLDKAPDLANMPRPGPSKPYRGGKSDGPRGSYKRDENRAPRPKRDDDYKPRPKPRDEHRPVHKPKSDFNPDQGAPEGIEAPKPKQRYGKEDFGGKKKSAGRPKDKKFGKSSGSKPEGSKAPAKKPYQGDAKNTSKRFTPPGAKPTKGPGGKPRVSRGANAVPKRGKK
ncbi:DEAD/DEAH box helicase [Actibacterium lipolyticum]|uniref:ATP-dependent RNA helicase DeaD n=1 Tax=Actibacterium lipolyticum TaxID=1524263 RepID=A0A238KGC0_9RHOB|nr:DEAD/DEAH box helicase [Actibacterium lipolyticum]SMX41584.1 ATP-dependent RNA helicase DeaD [Actibacterium lipolyticum]